MKNISLLVPIVFLSGCAVPQAHAQSWEQWSETFTREELVVAALDKAHTYFNGVSNDSKVNLVIDPALEDHAEWISELATGSVGLYSGLGDIDIVVGLGGDYLAMQNLEKFQGTVCASSVEETYVGGCGVSGLAWIGYGPTLETGELGVSETLPSIIPHELFHSLQSSLYPRAGTLEGMQDSNHWLTEGTAEFFGYAVLDYLNIADYRVSIEEPWYYLPDPSIGLARHALPPESWNRPPEFYWMGQIATEYIVANAGVEAVLLIWSGMGQGMTEDEAFVQAIGMDISEFYSKFDRAYSNMFNLNTDLPDFETIEYCPDVWDCSGDGVAVDPQKESESFWWKLEYDGSVELPDNPENSNHGLDTNPRHVGAGEISTCEELTNSSEWTNGIAASFSHQLNANVGVSTQWYAFFNSLDANLDGVVCGPGDF